MKCARSFFNKTLLKKNIQRFWPLWALYLVLLLSMPVQLLQQNGMYRSWGGDDLSALLSDAAWTLPGTYLNFLLFVTAAMGVLVAMALFSYLCSPGAAGAMHTLPIRREGLFFTNFLSGLLFFWGPNVIVFLVTLALEGALGCLHAGPLAVWLLIACVYSLFFFALAVFCAVLTGHLVAIPVFYLVVNVLAVAVEFLLENVMRELLFGFYGWDRATEIAEWLTPVWKLNHAVGCDAVYDTTGQFATGVVFQGLPVVGACAGAAVVLMVLALLIYRKRAVERAGDVVAVGWVRPIFRYGVSAGCALGLGEGLYALFLNNVLPRGAGPLLFCMLIGGTIGYFAASMLLAKSFRVFRQWKGWAAVMAACAALVLAVGLDCTGFETWVPKENQVTSAIVTSVSCYPQEDYAGASYEVTDPEALALLLRIHEDVADHLDEVKAEGAATAEYTGVDCGGFNVTYLLTNGMTVRRSYANLLPVTKELLARPDSYAALLQEFINRPENVCQDLNLSQLSARPLVALYLTNYGGFEDGMSSPPYNETYDSTALETVRQAILKDAAEGNFVHTLLYEDEDIVKVQLELQIAANAGENGEPESNDYQYVALTSRTENTLKALNDLGLLPGRTEVG